MNRQTYKFVEHVIVDGGSDDGTLEILTSLAKRNAVILSEKDDGIYDAMNKGIELSSGQVLCFLNSDDVFESEDVIERLVAEFVKTGADCVASGIRYTRPNNLKNVVRVWPARELSSRDVKLGLIHPHPGFFMSAGAIDKVGAFDLSYRLAADFDLVKRCVLNPAVSVAVTATYSVRMRLGGATNSSFKGLIRQNVEIYRSLARDFSRFSIVEFIIFKMITRAQQYLLGKAWRNRE